jgi:hypothetical protein
MNCGIIITMAILASEIRTKKKQSNDVGGYSTPSGSRGYGTPYGYGAPGGSGGGYGPYY